MPAKVIPALDIDLWDDDAVLDPYPHWKLMRDLGSVVYLEKHGFYALPRYAEMKNALGDWQTFSSAQGAMLNQVMNEAGAGATLHSDPPVHTRQREIVGRPLTPKALQEMDSLLQRTADELVERLVAQKTLDAVTDLAEYLPMSIVSRQVGLPEQGRNRMLFWAKATFECSGPMNERAQAAWPTFQEAIAYSFDPGLPDRLVPGGWAAELWKAAAMGNIAPEKCPALTLDYWAPALDTTIAAIASAVWLFGRFPEQWRLLRKTPSLMSRAINEVLRLESPISYFSRVVTRDVEMEDVLIPKGARVLMMYGSANRDERKWDDAEQFDIRRSSADQLAFGYGNHLCLGLALARMEMRALFSALAERVEYFELGEMRRMLNNMLRQIETLPVTLHCAA